MAGNIISKEKVLTEFERLRSTQYELSVPELCAILAKRLCCDPETIAAVVAESRETA